MGGYPYGGIILMGVLMGVLSFRLWVMNPRPPLMYNCDLSPNYTMGDCDLSSRQQQLLPH